MVGFPASCDECKQKIDRETRQRLACAWETQPTFRMDVQAWAECGVQARPATDDAPAFPSVCAGFSASLPEVIEVARAHLHWTKGELTQFCRGYASEALLMGVELMSNATGETIAWISDNPRKKAG